MSSKDL